MEDANATRPPARVRVQPPLKLRMSRILLRRKRQLPQQEFASVWQILGLVEDEDWSGAEEANAAFVFLYAVDFTEIGLEGQLTRDAPVRILAVRPPVLQCPSPVEQHRIGTNLRDYLRSQLAASPLMRHFILVFKEQPLWRGRKSKSSSLLGRGQYVAVINAATQVNGLTPLEVRLVQEQEGGRHLTASPTERTVAGYSASMASRFSRSVDVTHHAQLQQIYGALPVVQPGLISPGAAGQQFTPRMSSMRRGLTNSLASNLNV
ncbi:hypothetical protein ACSSS7_001116 [Eimeria intestinalis]